MKILKEKINRSKKKQNKLRKKRTKSRIKIRGRGAE